MDYICSKCQEFCPAGTYIARKCDGKGRTDTACSLCKTKCRSAERGVHPGEFVKGQCTGASLTDVQNCETCRTCPNGTWAREMCSGVDRQDATVCEPCLTSCANQTHYYLKGDCILEKSSCQLCDPPCDPAIFETLQECGNNRNRVCRAKTRCGENCPKGYYTNGQCFEGAQVCLKCSRCRSGEYITQPCSFTQDAVCGSCTKACASSAQLFEHNAMVGDCGTGEDLQDAVQCTYSVTPVGMPCAANEWLSSSLSEAATVVETVPNFLNDNAVEPGNSMLPFRSDFYYESTSVMAVFLASVGTVQQQQQRQTVIKVVRHVPGHAQATLLHFLLPRVAYFSRLDATGSQRTLQGPYPTATYDYWDAVDVMFSWDRKAVYVFFSLTFDFIAKCVLPPAAADESPVGIPDSSCTYLSTVQFNGTTSFFSYIGCSRVSPHLSLICTYAAANSYAVVMMVDEVNGGAKREILGSGYPGLKLPLSPAVYDAGSNLVYLICEVSAGQGVMAISPNGRNAAYMLNTFADGVARSVPLHFFSL